MPARLKPTAPIAPKAILVGDPGRALMLAQELLVAPKMSNHARGLWGYTGETEAGDALTIQSTGMGGPSAAVVLGDLAELGVQRAVRVGTCTSLGELGLGRLLLAIDARPDPFGSLPTHGLRKEPGDSGGAVPDPDLAAALERQLGDGATRGVVVSLDMLHRSHRDPASLPGDVADMQTAAVLARAAELKLRAAALLIVAETNAGEHLRDEELESAAKLAGWAAAAVLSPSS